MQKLDYDNVRKENKRYVIEKKQADGTTVSRYVDVMQISNRIASLEREIEKLKELRERIS